MNNDACKLIRKKILNTAFNAGSASAHIGGALSCVEIITSIFTNTNISNNKEVPVDKFILSKGHACLSLYAALNVFNFIQDKDLLTFEKNNSDYPGHPVMNPSKGIHYSSGSLGNGLAFSCGLALAQLSKNLKGNIYSLIGDGECNEGIIWESLMVASKYKLSNLFIFVDHNKFQQTGSNKEIMDLGSLEKKFDSFGAKTFNIDGHDLEAIEKCLEIGKDTHSPKVIIANTTKGKGVSFIENNNDWHHKIITETLLLDAIKEIDNA